MKSLCLPFGMLLAIISVELGVRAAPLNPIAFSSLGTLELTSGTNTIDTGGALPQLRDASSNVVFTGTYLTQGIPGGSNYWGFDPLVAVFDFDSISIATNVTVNVIGTNPVAILSRGTVIINGVFDASGQDGHNGTGNNGGDSDGLGGAGGAGGGKGGDGGTGSPPTSTKGDDGDGPGGGNGYGAYGGTGGLSSRGNGAGFGGWGGGGFGGDVTDSDYGNLHQYLQGGAGGGGTGTDFSLTKGAGGGGGGGGVEIGALISIALGGRILANGGEGGGGSSVLAGGGSGGGVLLHAAEIGFTTSGALISADGGGFNGGGGRILVLTSSGDQVTGMYSVSRGTLYGTDGVLEFGQLSEDLQLPALSIELTHNATEALISWPTVLNLKYQLETNSVLDSAGWSPRGTMIVGDGSTNSVTDPVSGHARQFYRLHILP